MFSKTDKATICSALAAHTVKVLHGLAELACQSSTNMNKEGESEVR